MHFLPAGAEIPEELNAAYESKKALVLEANIELERANDSYPTTRYEGNHGAAVEGGLHRLWLDELYRVFSSYAKAITATSACAMKPMRTATPKLAGDNCRLPLATTRLPIGT